MEGKNPTQFSPVKRSASCSAEFFPVRFFDLARPSHLSIWPELANYFGNAGVQAQLARETEGVKEPERRAFLLVALIFQSTWVQVLQQVCSADTSGNVMEAMQTLSALLPMGTLLGPYFYGFQQPSAFPSTANRYLRRYGQFRARCFTEY